MRAIFWWLCLMAAWSISACGESTTPDGDADSDGDVDGDGDGDSDSECSSAAQCDDGIDCTEDSCDDGACLNTPADERCDDGLFCDGSEICDPSAGCQSIDPPDCDDGVECTEDTCDEGSGDCLNTPSDTGCPAGEFCDAVIGCTAFCCVDDTDCDDGDFCNGSEICEPERCCQPGDPPECDDDIDCTEDRCDPLVNGCAAEPNHELCPEGQLCLPDRGGCILVECEADADCDDGLFCNGLETCRDERCVDGEAPACGDGLDCTADLCDESVDACSHLPNHGGCDDGVFCNGVEQCELGIGCLPGEPETCDDGIGCTLDACDAESDGCAHTPVHETCDDGLFCNGTERCDADLDCLPGEPESCDDGVGCTEDTCDEDADACAHSPNHDACADDLFCNGEERCDPEAGCVEGEPVACDDDLGCTEDTCDEEANRCDSRPDDSVCADDVFCNGEETCDVILGCQEGSEVVCDDEDPCTEDRCDEEAGECAVTPLTVCLGSCLEILDLGLSEGDGVYTITVGDREMDVYCDMTTRDGGWTLLVNHEAAAGFFEDDARGRATNVDDPEAALYSILGLVDLFRRDSYEFLYWNREFDQVIVSTQSSSPFDPSLVRGCATDTVVTWSNYTPSLFCGYTPGPDTWSVINGYGPNWTHSVGQLRTYGSWPLVCTHNSGYHCNHIQFYVR